MRSKEVVLNLPFFQTMIDASYNGIIAIDPMGSIVICNKAAENLLNKENQEVLGKHLKEINPDAWPDFQMILKTGTPQIGKKVNLGDLTLVVNRTPIIYKNKVMGVVSIFQDISELEKNLAELLTFRQAARELDAIIESSFDGLYISDGKGKTLKVNSAHEKITGLKSSELVGKNLVDIEKEGLVTKSVALLVLKHHKRITISTRLPTGKDLLLTGNPIFDESENITMVVTNVRDMTELNTLNKELEESKRLTEAYQLKLEKMQIQQIKLDNLVAVSKQMRDVVELALRVANVDVPVLLQGETGVGKEVIARLIHNSCDRSSKGMFMKINCGAIPENLLESELFGYERGAFTGARQNGKRGLFELAEGGTLFLDEIETLSLNLQVKLLTAVQDLEIMRVGGVKLQKIDTRIIAASNQDLDQMVQRKTFREDLFFRLNVVPIYIPPLRERNEDIVPLLNYYLQKYNKKYKKNNLFSKTAIECLIEYQWSGNVRELSNLVERLMVMKQTAEILLEDLPPHIRSFKKKKLDDLRSLTESCSLKKAVLEFESNLIQEVISRCGSARKAANLLKVDPSTLTRKARRYKLDSA